MKRLTTVLLVALAACHNSGAATPGSMTGASSAEAALNQFIAAAKAQDLQAMGAVWGTSRGPARNTIERTELEKRELVIIRLLCQEQFRIAAKSPGVEGRQVLQVEMTRGANRVLVNFTTTMGPSDRWYVEDLEIEKLQALCR